MNTITEPTRKIPVIADVDVVVCGGGPGGLPAAIAAARHGARTLLIERHGFLGGLATAGLVAPILGHHAHNSGQPIVEGLLREMTERMHELGGAPDWEQALSEWGINFDSEALKRVADEMVQRAGVQPLFHTMVTDVITKDGKIQAVLIENKSGRQAITAKIVIDATGDGDVAFRAGAPTTKGRTFDGEVQAMGSFIHFGGVPQLNDEEKKTVMAKVRAAAEAGRFQFYNAGFLSTNDMGHGDHTSPNMTRAHGDSTNAWDLTRAEALVRKNAWELVNYLRKEIPGFEKIYVQETAPQVGPRESRQVVGDYVLTGDDLRSGRKFSDAIARGSWWIDIHCPLGNTAPVHLCVKECPQQEKCPYWAAEHDHMLTRAELYIPEGDWYDIPYRCLVPQKIDNLLVSGRCISATHEAMAGARVMGTCMAIGQAAGTAAALAVFNQVSPRNVNIQDLRRTLSADGALV